MGFEMPNLLTAKEVQELLNVDRTTIYRMLKDGRLTGIKVGHHWRFPPADVDALISGKGEREEIAPEDFFDALPLHCMQPIQDVFAEIADVGSVITDKEGTPLTRISNSCDFCKLILGSTEGRQSCFASWKKVAEHPGELPEFFSCHAGLQYAHGRIMVEGEVVASLVSGQFYAEPPDAEEERERVRGLAKKYKINPDLLEQAAREIRVCDRQEQLASWLQRTADTFGEISAERAGLMTRLKQISEMSIISS
jgi:excisionase family DNA binding protein